MLYAVCCIGYRWYRGYRRYRRNRYIGGIGGRGGIGGIGGIGVVDSVLYAVCCMLYALCLMLYAVYAVCLMRRTAAQQHSSTITYKHTSTSTNTQAQQHNGTESNEWVLRSNWVVDSQNPSQNQHTSTIAH
jgi:Ca2+/H+ antiporter